MQQAVLVFKTSVTKELEISKLKPVLDELVDKAGKWNFDLEDCDNILRVEAVTLPVNVIVENLNRAGFDCMELED